MHFRNSISCFAGQLFGCQILLVLILFSSCKPAVRPSDANADNEEFVTMVFAGDVMHHMPQLYAAYEPSTGDLDYFPPFRYLKPYIKDADWATANLETVFGGKPYSGYPRFSAPDELFDALKDCGFDFLQLANNHILDRGSAGLERTVELIESGGLKSVGAYISAEHRSNSYPFIVYIRGVKLAFLNFTYGTNGLPTRNPNIVNKLDTAEMLNDLQQLKEEKPDIIIALPHWGDEYVLQSNNTQKLLARFLAANGVDLIMGSHPHVVQDAELINDGSKLVPVIYSLGNLISNQRDRHQHGGILTKVKINIKQKIVSSVAVIPFYVYKGTLDSKENYYLIPTSVYINNPHQFEIPDSEKVKIIEQHSFISDRIKLFPIE